VGGRGSAVVASSIAVAGRFLDVACPLFLVAFSSSSPRSDAPRDDRRVEMAGLRGNVLVLVLFRCSTGDLVCLVRRSVDEGRGSGSLAGLDIMLL
jgi:hypothetical protein